MKMTVKEAFEKYKEITIFYTFETTCPVCGKFYEEVDEGDFSHELAALCVATQYTNVCL